MGQVRLANSRRFPDSCEPRRLGTAGTAALDVLPGNGRKVLGGLTPTPLLNPGAELPSCRAAKHVEVTGEAGLGCVAPGQAAQP